MTGKPVILQVTYLDHCFDDTEKTLEEIQEDPISPTICTIIGYKTYENDEYLTISCERTNHNSSIDPYITYSNHITILKSAITEIKKL